MCLFARVGYIGDLAKDYSRWTRLKVLGRPFVSTGSQYASCCSFAETGRYNTNQMFLLDVGGYVQLRVSWSEAQGVGCGSVSTPVARVR